MLLETFGNFRKTTVSVSIAVETARPVLGHLIMIEVITYLRTFIPTGGNGTPQK